MNSFDEYFGRFAAAIDTGVASIAKLYGARTAVEQQKANAALAQDLIDLQRQSLSRSATLSQLDAGPIMLPSSFTGGGAFIDDGGGAFGPPTTAVPAPDNRLVLVVALAIGAILLARG